MTSEVDRLANRINGIEANVLALASAPQLAHSSIMDGAVDQMQSVMIGVDDYGNPIFEERLVSRYGLQDDGSNTVSSFDGPQPPRPVGFTVVGGVGFVAVEWFGEFENRIEPYRDHAYVAVHVGTTPGFTPMADTLKGTLRASQGESLMVGRLVPGAYYVTLVAVSLAGVWGPPSPYEMGLPGEATAVDVVARQLAQDALDAANAASSAANAAGQAASDAQADATSALLSADGKTRLWYATVPPAVGQGDDGDMWWERDTVTGLTSHVYEKRGGVWEERVLSSTVIDSIEAGQITTGVLRASTTISVGEPDEEHLTLGQSSLRVYRVNKEGDLTATINVGGADGDSLIILDPTTGATKAGFNADGDGVARSFDVETLTVGGVTIEDMLVPYSRGLKASMKIASTRPMIGTTQYGLYEVSALLEPGRIYKTRFVANFVHNLAGGSIRLWLRYTDDGTPPYIGSPQMMMAWNSLPVALLPYRLDIDSFFHVGLTAGEPKLTRILVTSATLSGAANLYFDANAPGFFTIEDVGPIYSTFMTDGVASGGGGSGDSTPVEPPPASGVSTRTELHQASWTRSWRNGVVRTDNDMVQGSYDDNNVSQAGFPAAVSTALAGSTVQKIEVFLFANYWDSSDGGAAVIGVHGATSPPAAFSYSGSLTIPDWARGAGKWVTLPAAWHSGFKNGSSRGVTLGGGAPADHLYYGRFSDLTATSGKPAVRITYTK